MMLDFHRPYVSVSDPTSDWHRSLQRNDLRARLLVEEQ